MDDERGAPFQEYSNRMAKAYNQTTHCKNRNKTNPNECFENTLAFAKEIMPILKIGIGNRTLIGLLWSGI